MKVDIVIIAKKNKSKIFFKILEVDMISKKIIEYSTACKIFNVIKNTKNKLNNLLKKAKSIFQ